MVHVYMLKVKITEKKKQEELYGDHFCFVFVLFKGELWVVLRVHSSITSIETIRRIKIKVY